MYHCRLTSRLWTILILFNRKTPLTFKCRVCTRLVWHGDTRSQQIVIPHILSPELIFVHDVISVKIGCKFWPTGSKIVCKFWPTGLKQVWKIVYCGLRATKGFENRAAHEPRSCLDMPLSRVFTRKWGTTQTERIPLSCSHVAFCNGNVTCSVLSWSKYFYLDRQQ